MKAFIDAHREVQGGPRGPEIDPGDRFPRGRRSAAFRRSLRRASHEHAVRRLDPGRLPPRARRDARLSVEIRRVFNENFGVYGVREIWRQMLREGFDVARCTVSRLMRSMGLSGAVRGKRIRTTVPDPAAPCPRDRVYRVFRAPAPNMPGLSGFTYVATWGGFVYVALALVLEPMADNGSLIDAFARRIVGWRVSRVAAADFALDALDQAPRQRPPFEGGRLIRHSDRGAQYVSIRTTERLAEAGIEPSVGSVGDSYDCEIMRAV